jgi:hypothetical protein
MTWLLGTAQPDPDDVDADPEEGSDYQTAADEMWDQPDKDAVDPATFESEPDPPPTDPWIAALSAAAAVPAQLLDLLRPMSRKNWQRLLKLGLPRDVRLKLRAWVRERRASGEIQKHSSEDGYIAEKALLVLYLVDRNKVASQVMAGRRVGTGTLDDVATQGSIWATVKAGLYSAVTSAVGQPDILDPDLRHVYEIKPKAQAVRGAQQLYGRYLLFLNAWEVFTTVGGAPSRRALSWAARVLAAFSVLSGPGGVPDLSSIGPVRFWTPGPWTPPRRIILWDGRLMDAEAPIPGVLCYQILGKKNQNQPGSPVPVDIRDIATVMLGLVLAQALADAANQASGAPGLEALARVSGTPQADGRQLQNALIGVGAGAAVGAGAWLSRAALIETLSAVGAWLEGLSAGIESSASGIPVFILVDPDTGAPVGLPARFGRNPDGA